MPIRLSWALRGFPTAVSAGRRKWVPVPPGLFRSVFSESPLF